MMKNNLEAKVIAGIGEKKSNGGSQWFQQDRIYDGEIAISVTTGFNPYCAEKERRNDSMDSNLRIRKLTPTECFRLQGLKDEDIKLVMEHQTNASGYHLSQVIVLK